MAATRRVDGDGDGGGCGSSGLEARAGNTRDGNGGGSRARKSLELARDGVGRLRRQSGCCTVGGGTVVRCAARGGDRGHRRAWRLDGDEAWRWLHPARGIVGRGSERLASGALAAETAGSGGDRGRLHEARDGWWRIGARARPVERRLARARQRWRATCRRELRGCARLRARRWRGDAVRVPHARRVGVVVSIGRHHGFAVVSG